MIFNALTRGLTIFVIPVLILIAGMVFLCFFSASSTQAEDRAVVNAPGSRVSEGEAAGSSFVNNLGMKFVYIPPGTFMMGSPCNEPGRNEDENQHRVTLTRGFYMQTTEVTQNQWKAVMGNNPSHFSDCGGDCPVERVSWDIAKEFIEKLNKDEFLKRWYQKGVFRRYRLPTEAEWEYACRAGSEKAFTNGEIRETDCGNDFALNKMGWYCWNSGGSPHPVAQKAPNSWGLFDMHGNVFEWTGDRHRYYHPSRLIDPVSPELEGSRVIRGGSWKSYARFCRSADRNQYPSDFYNRYLGFRLVAEVHTQSDESR